MVLDLKNNKKNNNYAMAQANVYRIYFLYLLKGAFLELLFYQTWSYAMLFVVQHMK